MSVDQLLELNPSLRNNPNLIRPGQSISFSAPSSFSLPDFELPSLPAFNIATSAKGASDNVTSSLMRGLTALREFAEEANQSIYAGSQEAQSYISTALSSMLDTAKSIPGAVADVKKVVSEDIIPTLKHTANVYPSGMFAALKYAVLPDDYEVNDGIPQSARNALARIVAENEDRVKRQGIGYDLYQAIGGGTDLAGGSELPTDYGADIASKIIGGVGSDGITFNEDGGVTIRDKFNVNLSTDLMRGLRGQRLESSDGKNLSGAALGDAELYMQLARNAMASVRPDMYDYQYPPTPEGLIDPREREIPGYWNVVNLTPEEIQAAREGRQYVPDILGGDEQVSGLLSFLKGLGEPTQGGTRGF